MKKRKHPAKSVTLWINFLILALSMFDQAFFETFGFSEHDTNRVLMVCVKITALLNLVLRVFFTNSALNFKSGPDDSNAEQQPPTQ